MIAPLPIPLWRPSPNFNDRPKGAIVSAITVHADGDRSVAACLAYICTREAKVSYHTVVSPSGVIYEVVDRRKRAWHDGDSAQGGVRNVNDFSIGVCLGGNPQDGHHPFPDVQLETAAAYCAMLMKQFPAITLARVVTHADVALPKGRKVDPYPAEPTYSHADFRDRITKYL